MTKLDYVIALAAALMALVAAALWLTREPSISLEDAPPVARQLVSQMEDAAVQKALAEGKPIRLRELKPDKNLPTFHPVGVTARDYESSEAKSEDCARRLAALSESASSTRHPIHRSASTFHDSVAQADAEAQDAATAAGAAALRADCQRGAFR